ncbi:MAG: relaxase/mobilization nuclease domain-containing protein [Bacteroidota bacterium]|nr:relaxase/mobilization nuclease domain-containing protein [Bacteroidota bacterium]
MISKVIIGKTFYGACRYVCMDQKRAVVLETEGVRDYNYKLMSTDFEMQRALRPTLSKAVFHGIISFYPGEKIEDKMIVEIAKEYLQKMNIINTQYAITKHTDKNHSHLHIIANLVDNKGKTIKDNWIGLKGKKIAQLLTIKYGLKEAVSKNLSLINLKALNDKEASRYIIYQAILEHLPLSKNLDDFKDKLVKKNIETLYKYKGQTNELQGISFKIGDYKYKGSEIDRKFSVKNLERIIQQQEKMTELKPKSSLSNSSLLPKKRHPEIKHNNDVKNIADILLKPEDNYQQIPNEFKLIKKHKKKKSRGLHL